MCRRKEIQVIEIELSFLNLPRFLGQELLTPDPLGELSLTLVLGLRGTKRTFRVSHERNFRQTRKGSPEPRAPKRESDVCQILVSTVKGVGGTSWTSLYFEEAPNEPKGNGACADTGSARKSHTRSEKEQLPLTTDPLCAGL